MKKQNTLAFAMALGSSLFAIPSQATFSGGGTGFVTPSELTIHMTSLSMTPADGSAAVTIWTGDNALTFKRSDTSLAKTEIGTITIPEGRYTAITMGMGSTFTVKIDANKYQGSTSGSISTGTALYSVGTGDLTANNALDATGPAVAISLSMGSGGTGPSSQTIFPSVLCVSASGSLCQTGDYQLVQQGNDRAASTTSGTVSATPGDLNILMDLYHAIRVDAANKSATFSNSYPILLYGDVGASIHMANSGTTPADIGLLFASDKSLQAVYGNAASVQYPNGFAQVTVSSAPTGYPKAGNMAFVAKADMTSTGTLTFPMTSDSGSRGTIGLTGFLAAVDSTVAGTCTDDTSGSLTTSAGNFAWTGQACSGGANGGGGVLSSFSYTIERVVDPNNVLGICASSPCKGSNTDTDGYQ